MGKKGGSEGTEEGVGEEGKEGEEGGPGARVTLEAAGP